MSKTRISKSGKVIKPKYWQATDPVSGLTIEAVTENLKVEGLIVNMQSGNDCYSRVMGYCQLENPEAECYACKAERCYPGVLPQRRRQEIVWDKLPGRTIGKLLITLVSKGRRLAYIKTNLTMGFLRVRFNESGEIKSKKHLRKLIVAMSLLKEFLAGHGIRMICAGYSANIELKNEISKISFPVIKGSGKDLGHGICIVVKTASDCPKGFFLCKGDCRICVICGVIGTKVAIPLH